MIFSATAAAASGGSGGVQLARARPQTMVTTLAESFAFIAFACRFCQDCRGSCGENRTEERGPRPVFDRLFSYLDI